MHDGMVDLLASIAVQLIIIIIINIINIFIVNSMRIGLSNTIILAIILIDIQCKLLGHLLDDSRVGIAACV